MNSQYNLKVRGKVVSGQKEGRKLGFPTANLNFSDKVESGVYRGIVEFEGQKYKAGVIYFAKEHLLEAHLLDFSGDLYEKEIEVEIIEKIRDIVKFKNSEELIEQIKKDLEIIKNA